MEIGFVGLGGMGGAIAVNLIRGGHQVSVGTRTAEKAQPLIRVGARAAATPREAADNEIVISMLADDRAVESVVFGDNGILSADRLPLHVSMSTISIDLAQRLTAAHGAKGGRFVSATGFGRPQAALAAKLSVLAAGPPEDLEACPPVFPAN